MDPGLENLSEETAESYALVLSAAGIAHRLVDTARGWRIEVQPTDCPRALAAVARYREENAPDRSPAAAPEAGGRRTLAGIVAALFLLGCNLALGLYQPGPALVHKYGAASEAILGGELYRCVTALLLHAGPLHLLTNLIGLALFATAVCSLTGGGLGCFMLLLSGAVGNGLNSLLAPSGHLSIGASTAVFGAIGILTACSFLQKLKQRNRLRAMVPVGGGLALLAILGSAAHTDVMAHLCGFAAGGLCGGGFAYLVPRPPGRLGQYLFGTVTLAILALSWFQAPEGAAKTFRPAAIRPAWAGSDSQGAGIAWEPGKAPRIMPTAIPLAAESPLAIQVASPNAENAPNCHAWTDTDG